MAAKVAASKKAKLIWFKAKNYGWGWYPSTWQGWFVLAVYLVLIYISTKIIDYSVPMYLFFVIYLTTGLIVTCYKTGEKPEWRWGSKRNGQN